MLNINTKDPEITDEDKQVYYYKPLNVQIGYTDPEILLYYSTDPNPGCIRSDRFVTLNDYIHVTNNISKSIYADSRGALLTNKTFDSTRSVIIDKKTNKILSIAPHRSHQLPYNYWLQQTPNNPVLLDIICNRPEDLSVTTAVEGTMINLFYNPTLQIWEISTKHVIGARTVFYKNKSNKTFRDMFMDVFKSEGNINIKELNEIKWLNEIPKEFMYSFVLQHPDNHMVFTIDTPKLYLVGLYENMDLNVKVLGDKQRIKYYLYEEYSKMPFYINALKNNVLCDLEYHPQSTYNDLLKRCENKEIINIQNVNEIDMGYMFFDKKTGFRFTIKNFQYIQLKNIRGHFKTILDYFSFTYMFYDQPNGDIFIKYFPMYEEEIKKYRKILLELIDYYYDLYNRRFVLKTHNTKIKRKDYDIINVVYKFYHNKEEITPKHVCIVLIEYFNKFLRKKLVQDN